MKNFKLLLSLLILVVVGVASMNPILAQENVDPEVKEETEATESQRPEYILPWPGILPDSPFYQLKMVRDKIWGFLIRDPLKKSQWSLLMADKRIWAAEMLVEKEKVELAVTTATKAEKYLESAVNKLIEAKEMGKEDRALTDKLINASFKHEDILVAILEKAPEDLQPVVEEVLKYPQDAREKALGILAEEL